MVLHFTRLGGLLLMISSSLCVPRSRLSLTQVGRAQGDRALRPRARRQRGERRGECERGGATGQRGRCQGALSHAARRMARPAVKKTPQILGERERGVACCTVRRVKITVQRVVVV